MRGRAQMLVAPLVDMAVVNCWLLFKRKNPTLQITLPQLRKELAYCLLNIDKKIWSGRSRPPIQTPPKKSRRIAPHIRYPPIFEGRSRLFSENSRSMCVKTLRLNHIVNG